MRRQLTKSLVVMICAGIAYFSAVSLPGQSKTQPEAQQRASKVQVRAVKRQPTAEIQRYSRITAAHQAIQEDLAPEIDKLRSALTRQKGYAQFKAQADRILKQKAGPLTLETAAAQAKQLKDLNQQYSQLLTTAYKKAGVDPAKIDISIERHLRFTGIPERLKKGPGPVPTYVHTIVPLPDFVPLPSCFTPPFELESSNSHTDLGAANNTPRVNRQAGTFRIAGEAMIAGGGWNRASVGDRLRVPAGVTRVRVTARINARHDLWAFSGIGGGSWAYWEDFIEVARRDGRTDRHADTAAYVAAPLLWFQQDRATRDYVMEHTFDCSPGEDLTIRAGASNYYGTIIGGASYAFVQGTVSELCAQPLR